jgi:hypothetical protein
MDGDNAIVTPPRTDEDCLRIVRRLLGGQDVRMERLAPSGNNRLFRIDGAGRPIVAKWYLQDGSDRRERQTAEWQFLRYCEELGLHCVPRGLEYDSGARVTLLSFVEGRSFGGSPGEAEVAEAARFAHDLNPSARPVPADLSPASEGGFSFADHDAQLVARLDRLRELYGEDETIAAARILVAGMERCHERWRDACGRRVAAELARPLPQAEHCVSPSDFGFHNVLVGEDDRLSFLDFEYAGWDDPAKLVCDFFWQPRFPVPLALREPFVKSVLAFSREIAFHRERVHLLDPLFGLKWCCILLNPFLPQWEVRHAFAAPSGDLEQLRRTRLKNARQYLDRATAMI